MKHTSNFLSTLLVRGIGWLPSTLSFLVLVACCASATAQTTAFTYQGKLADNGTAVTGNYDFEFRLFDLQSAGTQQGSTLTLTSVHVDKGVFTVQLDFIACPTCVPCPICFNGSNRFLDITVRPAGAGTFTPLTPRQPMTSTPYALKSLNASTADGLSLACLNCVNSSQIASVNGSAVAGLIPVGSVPAGSTNYIQSNPSFQQPSSSFNISGNGTAGGTLNANIVNATTQYNIGGLRVFKYDNVTLNTYVGFLGNTALGGTHNSFFGGMAAVGNTGTENSFFGYVAGGNNNTGDLNSFFGALAGAQNSGGGANSFFGYTAGSSNQTARFNSFFGYYAGQQTTMGEDNAFFGATAGQNNTTGGDNTLIGAGADVASGNLNFATAIGGGAVVSSSNTIVLGRSNGVDAVLIPGTLNVSGNGTGGGTLSASIINAGTQYNIVSPAGAGSVRIIGISGTGDTNTFVGRNTAFQNPTGSFNSLFGNGAGRELTGGGNNSFFGSGAGNSDQNGNDNSFFGRNAGFANTANGNSFFGSFAGSSNTAGANNTIIGSSADVGANNLLNATAIGSQAQVTQSNSMVLGSITGVNNSTADTNIGIGTTAPVARLQIVNNSPDGSSNTAVFSAPYLGPNFSHIHFGGHGDWYIRSSEAAGKVVLQDSGGKVGIGTSDLSFKLHVVDSSNTGLRVQTITAGGTVASFGQNGAFSIDGPASASGRLLVGEDGKVEINRDLQTTTTAKLYVHGKFAVTTLDSGGTNPLCWNPSLVTLAACSSSIRYKQKVNPFASGLSLINRLRPVSFNWKADNKADMGLIAEEVEQVEPLLVTRNDKGEIEGVKYDRVGVVLINAVKEQQQQIEKQRKQIEEQQKLIEALRILVC